jgi:hypothetical protein
MVGSGLVTSRYADVFPASPRKLVPFEVQEVVVIAGAVVGGGTGFA